MTANSRTLWFTLLHSGLGINSASSCRTKECIYLHECSISFSFRIVIHILWSILANRMAIKYYSAVLNWLVGGARIIKIGIVNTRIKCNLVTVSQSNMPAAYLGNGPCRVWPHPWQNGGDLIFMKVLTCYVFWDTRSAIANDLRRIQWLLWW